MVTILNQNQTFKYGDVIVVKRRPWLGIVNSDTKTASMYMNYNKPSFNHFEIHHANQPQITWNIEPGDKLLGNVLTPCWEDL